MKSKTVVLLAGAMMFGAGCQQAWRHPTAGEEIVQSAQSEPVAATAPSTSPTTATVAAKTPTPPTSVASVATTKTSAPRTPVVTGNEVYVAADADEATRMRNWNPVTNYYPNGGVIAGPVYRIITPPPRSLENSDVIASDIFQTVMTVPQMVATPIWMFFTPPMTPVEYHGEIVPASYTLEESLPFYEDEKVRGTVQMKR